MSAEPRTENPEPEGVTWAIIAVLLIAWYVMLVAGGMALGILLQRVF